MTCKTATTTVLLLTLGLAPAAAVAAMKCWTNKEGVKECGNVVPPEYADQGHTEIGKTGVRTGEQKRARTAEEIEAEKAKTAADAAAKAETARRTAEQAAADKVLIDTFSSEDDMILTRDGRISNIESQVKLTESHIQKLQNNLDQIIKQAAEIERRGETPSEKVEKDIENVRKQIDDQQAFIASKRVDQDKIRAQFDVDIARFRELKARQAKDKAEKEAAAAAKP